MAKAPVEVILTDAQKRVRESFKDSAKATEYMQAVTISQKLGKRRARIGIREANQLLNFFENSDFTDEEKKSIGLEDKSKKNLIKSVSKTKNAQYAERVATQPLILSTKNKSLTKLISKDREQSLDYATFYFNKHQGKENVEWCFDAVLKPVKKNVMSKKAYDSSYERLAKFIFDTVPYPDDANFNSEYYNNRIKGVFADKLFGTDDDIRNKAMIEAAKKLKIVKRKDIDKKGEWKYSLTDEHLKMILPYVEKALARKKNFIIKVCDKLIELNDSKQIAKIDSAEEELFMQKINDEVKKSIEALANKKFEEKYGKQLSTANAVLADIKKRHPHDYEKYLDKLRNSKTYKQAYTKYYNEFKTAKAGFRSEAIRETKATIEATSRAEVLGAGKVAEKTEDATM